MLSAITYLILAVAALLAIQTIKHSGYALAICWSMLTLESVLQQGNSFLIQNSSFVNIGIAGLTGVAAIWVILNQRLKQTKVPLSLILYCSLLLVAYVSTLWSLDPRSAGVEINKAAPYIAVYCIFAPLCAFDEKQLRNAINGTIYFGGLVLVAVVLSERGRRGIYLTTIGGVEQQANPLANASYAGMVTVCALFSIYQERAKGVLPVSYTHLTLPTKA